jgi:hypothetical protein
MYVSLFGRSHGHRVVYVAPSQLRSFAGLKKGDPKISVKSGWACGTDEGDAAILALMAYCKFGGLECSEDQQALIDRLKEVDTSGLY